MAFILDNSVTSGWFLENQASPYTDAIAVRLNEEAAHAPALWEAAPCGRRASGARP